MVLCFRPSTFRSILSHCFVFDVRDHTHVVVFLDLCKQVSNSTNRAPKLHHAQLGYPNLPNDAVTAHGGQFFDMYSLFTTTSNTAHKKRKVGAWVRVTWCMRAVCENGVFFFCLVSCSEAKCSCSGARQQHHLFDCGWATSRLPNFCVRHSNDKHTIPKIDQLGGWSGDSVDKAASPSV